MLATFQDKDKITLCHLSQLDRAANPFLLSFYICLRPSSPIPIPVLPTPNAHPNINYSVHLCMPSPRGIYFL